LTVDPEDPTQGLLSGCVRGRIGDAHAFADGAVVTVTMAAWSIEDAWAARLDGALGDQITDTSLTLKVLDYEGFSPMPTPAVGDEFSIGDEDVLVTDVDGLTCDIARAQNGTTIAAHNDGAYVYRYSPSMERVAEGGQAGYANGSIRTGLLEEFYLRNPTLTPGLARILYWKGASGTDLLCRGGASKPLASGGMAEVYFPSTSNPSTGLIYSGFRCVWRPDFD
jgi:hypothetical protein